MSSYQTFTTNRAVEADFAALLAQLRALDPTAGIQHQPGSEYVIKKATAWTQPQINAVQGILDNAASRTPQLLAQAEVDQLSILQKAIILTILDQFNVVRSKLSPPLAAITVPQMIAAIRTKAGEIS